MGVYWSAYTIVGVKIKTTDENKEFLEDLYFEKYNEGDIEKNFIVAFDYERANYYIGYGSISDKEEEKCLPFKSEQEIKDIISSLIPDSYNDMDSFGIYTLHLGA